VFTSQRLTLPSSWVERRYLQSLSNIRLRTHFSFFSDGRAVLLEGVAPLPLVQGDPWLCPSDREDVIHRHGHDGSFCQVVGHPLPAVLDVMHPVSVGGAEARGPGGFSVGREADPR